jgi:hypothetical protein
VASGGGGGVAAVGVKDLASFNNEPLVAPLWISYGVVATLYIAYRIAIKEKNQALDFCIVHYFQSTPS